MSTQIFDLDCEWDGPFNGVTILFKGQIELDQRILDAVDDDWRKHLYNLIDDKEVAEHIAYNLIVNRVRRVNQLDGWADQPDDVVAEIL